MANWKYAMREALLASVGNGLSDGTITNDKGAAITLSRECYVITDGSQSEKYDTWTQVEAVLIAAGLDNDKWRAK